MAHWEMNLEPLYMFAKIDGEMPKIGEVRRQTSVPNDHNGAQRKLMIGPFFLVEGMSEILPRMRRFVLPLGRGYTAWLASDKVWARIGIGRKGNLLWVKLCAPPGEVSEFEWDETQSKGARYGHTLHMETSYGHSD